jgi:hypothetical protein
MALSTLPPWTRTANHESYGSHVNKRDFGAQGTVHPETDVQASDLQRLGSDLAAVVRTAPKAVITYAQNDTGTDDPVVLVCKLQTGIAVASYAGDAPPSGFPTAIRQGDGDVVLTFASTYDDEFGTSGAFEVTDALGGGEGTAFLNVVCEVTSATTVRVRCFDADGAADTDRTVTVEIG